ncbi:MAG: enoyl-CoA hydratase/isomerase family protein [Alphaproteobacteria bacterium]|nr:enoyl-CoA hydratase/isomerase family protein [Alphaproteobacteria bacterium]
MADAFANYRELTIERRDNGVVLIVLDRPKQLNAMTYGMHGELARLWDDIQRDKKTKVAVVTGRGRAFCSGNDLNNPDPDFDMVREIMDDAISIIRGMVECSKPIISAINGVAVGAGLAVALMADISIAAEDAKLIDGHTRVGVAAGDHACIIWPLLCGMAKAKYYLWNIEPLTGKEAERIGVVTKALPVDQVLPEALRIAGELANMSQPGIRGTKRAINGWLRQAMPIFEHSAALEMVDFFGPDVHEARAAFRAKRPPKFPSAG